MYSYQPFIAAGHRVTLGAALVLVLANFALADTLHPSDDSFINLNQPDGNKGDNVDLVVRNQRQAFVRFELSPATEPISSAGLRLFVRKVNGPGTISLHLILGDWNEATLTPNTAPPIELTPFDQVSIAAADELSYVLVDVTGVVQEWLDGTTPDFGIAILPDASVRIRLDSKENDLTSHPAELEIVPGTIDFATNAGAAASADFATTATNADFAASAGTATTATSALTAGNANLLDGLDSDDFVSGVTASSPLVSSGGATPDISLPHVGIGVGGFGESTAIGIGALSSLTGGIRSTAVGAGALSLNNANHNTGVGRSALQNATGGENAAVGAYALSSQTTGGGNTAIGYNANVPVGSSISNSTAIGYLAVVDASNKIRLGNGGVTLVETAGDLRVGAGSPNGCVQDGNANALVGTCISDLRLKTQITPFSPLLERLVSLEPVHFLWRAAEHPELQLGSEPSYGLIAQDVERIFPELVDDGPQGYKVVRYGQLPLMLLMAIKEQQEIIGRQRAENDDLRERVERLEHLLGAGTLVAGR